MTNRFRPGDLVQWDPAPIFRAEVDSQSGVIIEIDDNLITRPKVLILWQGGNLEWMTAKHLRVISCAKKQGR
jgi:hypothetical protein